MAWPPPTKICSNVLSVARLVRCVRTVCSADTMKPSQGGRGETTLHLCRRHKGLHMFGDWWPWPSASCYCVSVLEDGGRAIGILP